MKKKLSVLLLLCMLLAILPQPAAAVHDYDPTMKIGLYYDSAALVAANLQNVRGTGEGYEFGYYDERREFISTYTAEYENQITVLKNECLWRSGDTYSDLELASYDEEIGAYCLQVDALFLNTNEALDICNQAWQAGLDAYICYVTNGYRVRIGKYMSSREAAQEMDDVTTRLGWPIVQRSPSETCYTVVRTGTSEILYQFDTLGNYVLGIRPLSSETWFKGMKYRGGFEYNRVTGNNINVINVVSLSDYIKGVIPMEVNVEWPIEAQKAQALCAKCYALNNFGKHRSKGFDLCDTADCQVYGGTQKSTEVSDRAVDELSGLYVLYDGKICQTYYHSSSGGYTEDCANVWGKDIPYLKAVEDRYLEKMYPYSYTLTIDQISWILNEKGYVDRPVTDLYVSEFTPAGNVRTLTAELSNGDTVDFKGDRARTALNSKTLGVSIGSQRYTINGEGAPSVGGSGEVFVNGELVSADGLYITDGRRSKKTDIEGMTALTARGEELVSLSGRNGQPDTRTEHRRSDEYVIAGTGWGHNIGLCQWGAHAMANRGFTCEEIIEFYFTGAVVDYYDPN